MREVVARVEALTVDNLSVNKGYVMKGDKGDFIVARDTFGKYIWVRLNPTKTTAKPVKSYNTLRQAVEEKINKGYKVFEYSDVTVK